jgi:hypothetical protein
MYGIVVNDFDKDGNADIIMGGNFYESKPEVGIYDASYGIFLKEMVKETSRHSCPTKRHQHKRRCKRYAGDE